MYIFVFYALKTIDTQGVILKKIDFSVL